MPRPTEREALTRRAVTALEAMPDTMRLILLLHAYDGWSGWEIAHATRYNIKIVRSLLERGFQGMEKALGQPMERGDLRELAAAAFEAMIESSHPDMESVARLRAHLYELCVQNE